MNTPAPVPAYSPEQQAALKEEIALIDWVIVEAKQAHDVGKAHAERNGKPYPLTALRIVVQAHNRKMALLGFAPVPSSASRKTAKQLAAEVAETRSHLIEAGATETAAPITNALPAAPHLNRAQRRALERSQTKRKAA